MPRTYEEIKKLKESDPEFAERLRGYAKAYVARNPEKERERQRVCKEKKRAKDRDVYNAYMRAYNAKNPPIKKRVAKEKRQRHPDYEERKSSRLEFSKSDYQRYWKLKQQYGITLHDYNRMYESQNGRCAICSDERKPNGKDGLVVDHCHNKGHIRKLLCPLCNKGLGNFKDDVGLLQKAIDYLTNN